ncbi:MAG: pantoate--beta-alanine ligase [Micromonosporaceae bacterium]
MRQTRQIDDVRALVREWRSAGETVGAVMTMGYLHPGHLSLVAAARQDCDRVLGTVFVNPLQFGPAEDYGTYPRDEARDLAMLAEAGCDGAFMPSVQTMFPNGERDPRDSRTTVHLQGLTEVLCGRSRPGHFVGVCTEVLKMFNILGVDISYFGEKDYQQYLVIRAMVEDLALPVRVVACPTLREPDGTAMSSRHAYLAPAERAIAPRLYATLSRTATALATRGSGAAADLTDQACTDLLAQGFTAVEYVEVRDHRLAEPGPQTDPRTLRVFGAVHLGGTRLIDNVAVAEHQPDNPTEQP